MDDEQRLRAGIRALAAEDRQGPGSHPSPDELLAYYEGDHEGDHAEDVSADERERIQDHLARCSECARTVLDLSSFPNVEPAREEDRLSDFDLAAEWRRFQERAGTAPARPAKASPFASARLAYALAAALLLAVIGLSIWVVRLREEAAGPRVNVLLADLLPREAAVERSADEETIRFPEWADRLLLILNLAEAPSHSAYRVEIATPEGREVWSRRGLRPSADGNFTLEVPRSLLPGERYVVRLYGLQGNEWGVVAEYGVRIRRGR